MLPSLWRRDGSGRGNVPRIAFALLVLGFVSTFGAADANATTPHVHSMTLSSCATLSGVTLTMGTTLLTTTSTQLRKADNGAPLYGVGVASGTTIVSVSSGSRATMSQSATVSETNATLTVCPRGTGSVTCTNVSGVWKFSPGLLTSARPVKVSEDMNFNGCTTAPGNTNGSSSAVAHLTFHNSWASKSLNVDLSCADFEQRIFTDSDVMTTGKVVWNNPPARSSTFSFSGLGITALGGVITIAIPNTGGTVSVSGGYAGSSAAASLTANPNIFFTGKCTSIAGVESLGLDGGSVTFGQPAS